MASIHKEVRVHRKPDAVWDAIRDVGAIHIRLVPGFVVDCRLEGDSLLSGEQVELCTGDRLEHRELAHPGDYLSTPSRSSWRCAGTSSPIARA
jgi:hypothetical protein